MAPHRHFWIGIAAAGALTAQEAAYFQEERTPWWKPTSGEVSLQRERIASDDPPGAAIVRTRGLVKLRWEPAWSWGRFVFGTRHALGSDGNRFNVDRYDQEPSNGSRVDLAYLAVAGQSERAFGEVRLGLQDNPMLTQESLWDRDLSTAGVGGRAGFRSEAWGLSEIGVRGLAGRVRTFPGARVDVAAAQAVVRGEVGPATWTLHGGRFEVRWDADQHRLMPLAGSAPGLRQRMAFTAAGAGLRLDFQVPLEAKWISHRNVDTRQDGEELQVFVGSRTRTWWPQAGYVWQRYGSTGTPFVVNGDDWWFVRNAKGPRWMLALPLPKRFLLQASTLRHLWLGETFTRTQVTLSWRFGS